MSPRNSQERGEPEEGFQPGEQGKWRPLIVAIFSVLLGGVLTFAATEAQQFGPIRETLAVHTTQIATLKAADADQRSMLIEIMRQNRDLIEQLKIANELRRQGISKNESSP